MVVGIMDLITLCMLLLSTVCHSHSSKVWMSHDQSHEISCPDMRRIEIYNVTLDVLSDEETSRNETKLCSVETLLESTKKTCDDISSCNVSLSILTNGTCKLQNSIEFNIHYLCKPVFPCNITFGQLKKESFEKNLHGRMAGWTRDASWEVDSVFYLPVSKHGASRTLYKYPSLGRFKAGWPFVKYHLSSPPASTSFVLFNGMMFYVQHGTSTIIKYDLKQQKQVMERTLVAVNSHAGTIHAGIDFSLDQNGLWVMYSNIQRHGNLTISRLNMADLSTIKTWEINEQHSNVVSSFVICSTLYMVNSDNYVGKVFNTGKFSMFNWLYWVINYRYAGTNETITLPTSMPMSLSTQDIVSTSYNPRDNLLYVSGLEQATVYSFVNVLTEISQCPEITQNFITFPSVPANTKLSLPCPGRNNHFIFWTCMKVTESTSAWDHAGPNFDDCHRSNAEATSTEYSGDFLDENNPLHSASLLLDEVKSIENTAKNSVDISLYSEKMFNISTQNENIYSQPIKESKEIFESLLEASDAIMDEKTSRSWQEISEVEQSTVFTSIMDTMERSAFNFARKSLVGSEETFSKDSIKMRVQVVNTSNVIVGKMLSLHVDTDLLNGTKVHDDVQISFEDIARNGINNRTEIVYVVYRNFNHLLQFSNGNLTQQRTLNSHVVSLSIGGTSNAEQVKLVEPILLTLGHVTNSNQSATCVFWKSGNRKTVGTWSTEGCEKVASNSTHTQCSCNHLTSFALLVNHRGYAPTNMHIFVLSIVTWVGLTMSLICLALAITTFTLFKSLHCRRTTIHTNLCICLFVSQFIFLTAIDLHHLPILCSVIAGILHYTFLATFTWMALEGFQLYVMLVEVFERFNSIAWYYIIGYGVPAVFVATSAAINYKGYGTDNACWLSTDMDGQNYSMVPFIWAFIGPASFIGLANIFFIVLASIAIYMHARKYVYYSKLKAARSSLSATCALLFLLGSTWTFGIIWWWKQMIFLEYAFCILNAFQGVYIFLFHCIFHNKVRYEYRNLLAKCFGEKYFDSSSTSSLTIKYSGGRRRSSHTYHPKKWKSSISIKNNSKLATHGNNSVKALVSRRQSAPHIGVHLHAEHNTNTMQAIVTRKNSVTYIQPRKHSMFLKTDSNSEQSKAFFAQRHFSCSLHQLSFTSDMPQEYDNHQNKPTKRHSMVSSVNPCTKLVKEANACNDETTEMENEHLLSEKSVSFNNENSVTD